MWMPHLAFSMSEVYSMHLPSHSIVQVALVICRYYTKSNWNLTRYLAVETTLRVHTLTLVLRIVDIVLNLSSFFFFFIAWCQPAWPRTFISCQESVQQNISLWSGVLNSKSFCFFVFVILKRFLLASLKIWKIIIMLVLT